MRACVCFWNFLGSTRFQLSFYDQTRAACVSVYAYLCTNRNELYAIFANHFHFYMAA